MQIQENKVNKSKKAIKDFNLKKLQFLGYLAFTVVLGIFMFQLGIAINSKKARRDVLAKASKTVSHLPRTLIAKAKSFNTKLDKIVVDIKHTELQKIAYQRELGIKNRINDPSNSKYVKAKISSGTEFAKVKMRLKGIFKDHWQEKERWSFRIKTRNGKTLFGMKHFSLVLPRTREYIYEWLFQKVLKEEGLIAKRFKFVSLNLNGKDHGLYALEEHYSKQLIENNQRKEGPIVGFSKDLLIKEWTRNGRYSRVDLEGSSSFHSANIDGNQISNISRDSEQFKLFKKASTILEGFRAGKININDAFDTDKLAKFFAIKALFGSEELDYNDTKFYYNPISSKLEPIGAEIHFSRQIGNWWLNQDPDNSRKKPFVSLFFNDAQFLDKYFKELNAVSEKGYLKNLIKGVKPDLEKNVNLLYSHFPHFTFKEKYLAENQKHIKRLLNPIKGAHAYFKGSSNGQLKLDIANIQAIPIEILNLSYAGSEALLPASGKSKTIKGKNKNQIVNYEELSFISTRNIDWNDEALKKLKINYRVFGSDEIRSDEVFRWSFLKDEYMNSDFLKQEPNIQDFKNLLTIDKVNKRINFKTGEWTLRDNLIIPKAYTVYAKPGTTLNLQNEAKILSFSALIFEGTEAKPIIIQAPDGSGQGLIVMNTKETSKLNYLIFNGLSNPKHNDWALTGAVTFYEAPVEIKNSKFLSNRSEDALNIVRTNFSIDSSLFNYTFSDALDADFSNGKITNTSFLNSGNDAIDVSGADIELSNLIIDGAQDKGLSAGENSAMRADNIVIKNVEIAVVSKDLSSLKVKNLDIQDSKVGFAVFQKKPEFGPASISVNTLNTSNITVPHLVENNSSLNVDDKLIRSNEDKVKAVLYGVKFGKSTK